MPSPESLLLVVVVVLLSLCYGALQHSYLTICVSLAKTPLLRKSDNWCLMVTGGTLSIFVHDVLSQASCCIFIYTFTSFLYWVLSCTLLSVARSSAEHEEPLLSFLFSDLFFTCYFLFVSLLVPGIKFYFPHIFFSSSVSTGCPHSHISMLIYCLNRPLHLVELSLVVMCHLVLICFEFFGGLHLGPNSVVTQQYLTDCCFGTVFSFTIIYRIYRNLNVVIKPCNLKSLPHNHYQTSGRILLTAIGAINIWT